MSEAVKRVKRNITFEMCLYGWGDVQNWGPNHAQLWRTGNDIQDNFKSVLINLDRNDETRFQNRQGPTLGWNYPDALFVGKGGMTWTEYRTMFALWCAVKSPLMLGSDLTQMTRGDSAYEIVTNEELIGINQDPLGVQATCRKNCCGKGPYGAIYPQLTCPHFSSSWQVWQGPLEHNAFVVIVLNRYDHDIDINLHWRKNAKIPPGKFLLRDLWKRENVAEIDSEKYFDIGKLKSHENRAFKLTPIY